VQLFRSVELSLKEVPQRVTAEIDGMDIPILSLLLNCEIFVRLDCSIAR
jgi:hypothetical protein